MLLGRAVLAVAVALSLGAVLAACTKREGGAVSIMRSQDGSPAIAVTWCDDTPSGPISVVIKEERSGEPVAKFGSTNVRDHFATVNLTSPGPDWVLLSGDPRLRAGVDYRLTAWPGSGKEMNFGQWFFTRADFNDLKPGQIDGLYPGEIFTRSEFMAYARRICG